MSKNHFIVVVGHPVHGRIKRLQIPHYFVHLAAAGLIVALIVGIGLTASYGRMYAKVQEFNKVRAENKALQRGYDQLQETVEEREVQLASLGSLANEVSVAFGIQRDAADPAFGNEGDAAPMFEQSMNQFDRLQEVRLDGQADDSMLSYLSNTTPSIWPVRGRISSSFGRRNDPFNRGEGAFHSGIDISAASGRPIVATADGRVVKAGWAGALGQRVEISHGRNGLATVYGHMVEVYARAGQVVRRGEVIGRTGSTGRSTGKHVHYEVHYKGTRVNPYKYLQKNTDQVNSLAMAD